MIKKHGKKQIDIKLHIPIPRNDKRQNYSIEIWFFIPVNLFPGNKVYTTREFFEDQITYTRYQAPHLTLHDILDEENNLSPLNRLNRYTDRKQIIYELKTLLTATKNSSKYIISQAKKCPGREETEAFIKDSITTAEKIQKRLIALTEKSDDSELETAYQKTREGLSIRIEKTACTLAVRTGLCKEFLTAAALKQYEYRKKEGFLSIPHPEDEEQNSRLIYIEHRIKKWSENILYMEMEKSRRERSLKNILLGTAAAFAMLFALTASVISTRWFKAGSVYWVLTAIIAYSFKDRLKEGLRSLFLNKLPGLISDRIKRIVAPGSNIICGHSRERVMFPTFKQLSRKIQETRLKYKDQLSIAPVNENIIHYNKTVRLDSHKLYKNHQRLLDIAEIIRFDFRRWFHKMDKLMEKLSMVHEGKIIPIRGQREYHFTVIVKLRYNDSEKIHRYRIITSSSKITKIHKVI